MITLEGRYFDGRRPIDTPARLDFFDREVALTAGPISKRHQIIDLRVSPRIGSSPRFINFPDAGQFMCDDSPFLDSLPGESRSEGPVARLERNWGIALAGVVITACILLVGYYFGLPAAAERIARHIPMETQQYLGGQALSWMDENKWLEPTKVDAERRKAITDGFERLCSALPLNEYYRLEFRASSVLGPNAFALPGGTIVITDDMVGVAALRREMSAVLAHEIGHVELRHSMRSVVQNSVIAGAVVAVTSDAASLSAAVAGLPAIIAQTGYSRGFETAADDYAFRLLKGNGISPTAFASVMALLAEKTGEHDKIFGYLSSHPETAERAQRARDAAVDWVQDSQRARFVGKWLGEGYRPKAQIWMKRLLTFNSDGTYVAKFRGTRDNTKDQTISGRWDYFDGMIETVTTSVDGKPVQPCDQLHVFYKINSMSADEISYTHTKSGDTFQDARAPDGFDLP